MRQPSMSFTMFAEIAAASANFSCVKDNISLHFLMFADMVFRSSPALLPIYDKYCMPNSSLRLKLNIWSFNFT